MLSAKSSKLPAVFLTLLLLFGGSNTVAYAATGKDISAPSFSSQQRGFTRYPGFYRPSAEVEMITDRGLIQEIVLRCDVNGGPSTAGIMHYSKVERLFCSSKNQCYTDVEDAASETCGW